MHINTGDFVLVFFYISIFLIQVTYVTENVINKDDKKKLIIKYYIKIKIYIYISELVQVCKKRNSFYRKLFVSPTLIRERFQKLYNRCNKIQMPNCRIQKKNIF